MCKVFREIRAHFSQVANASLNNDNKVAFAEEVKILTLLSTTIFAFIICWIPSVSIDLYKMFAGYYTFSKRFIFLTPLNLLQVAVL